MIKVVLFFKGSNCAPCKMFEPIFNQTVDKSRGVVYTIMDDAELMRKLGLRSVPVVVLATAESIGDPIDSMSVVKVLMGKDLRQDILESSLEDLYNM